MFLSIIGCLHAIPNPQKYLYCALFARHLAWPPILMQETYRYLYGAHHGANHSEQSFDLKLSVRQHFSSHVAVVAFLTSYLCEVH